jgi:flagellar protein FlaG
MDTNVKILAVPAIVPSPSPATPAGDFDEGPEARKAEQIARYRLIIEEGPTRGTFIYKTLNSVTGEVIRQLPREEVLRMSETGDYLAGGLIDTSV